MRDDGLPQASSSRLYSRKWPRGFRPSATVNSRGASVRDKRKKFIVLAEKRVTRVLENLRLVGNLANRSNYEYNDRDADKILTAIEGEVKRLRLRFNSGTEKREERFKLDT
jgi:hypothetical protein